MHVFAAKTSLTKNAVFLKNAVVFVGFFMLKRLGFVDKNKGWKFCENLENKLLNERWNGKENISGRKSLWFGVGVELGFNSYSFEGETINEGLRKRCDELWGGDDWNSLLVYKYEKGCELKRHIDRDIFERKVVIINFCKSLVGFEYGNKVEWLKDGEVIEINNKVRHGVLKVESKRFSLSIRKVKV